MGRPKLPDAQERIQWCVPIPRKTVEKYDLFFRQIQTGEYPYDFRNRVVVALLEIAIENFRTSTNLVDLSPVFRIFSAELYHNPEYKNASRK